MVLAKVAQSPSHKTFAKLAPAFAKFSVGDSAFVCTQGGLKLIVCAFGTYLQMQWEADCGEECVWAMGSETTQLLLRTLKEVNGGFELHDTNRDAVRLVWEGGELEVDAVRGGVDVKAFPAKLAAVFEGDSVDALARVVKFAARASWSSVLDWVLAEQEGDKVLLVATDGYKLAAEQVEGCQLRAERVLLPGQLVELVSRVRAERLAYYQEPDDVGLICGFVLGDVRIWGAYHLDRDYPNWRDAVPNECVATLRLEVSALAQALKVADGMDADEVYLQSDGNRIAVHIGSLSERAGAAAVPLVASAEFPRLRLNPKLLGSVVKALGVRAGVIEVRIAGATKPIALAADGGRRLYLVMPMRQD